MNIADRVRSWHIPVSSLGPLANRLIRYGVALLVLALIFSLSVAWWLDVAPPSLDTSIAIMVSLAALNTLLQPVMIWIAVRFWAWMFPILSFLLNAGLVLAVSSFTSVLPLSGLMDAGIVVGITAGATTITGSLLSISDDRAWNTFALRPLRERYATPDVPETPGFVFLEIDGLSTDMLRFAKEHGYIETLAAWIDTGSHTLAPWECDLSSQTGASQAGILQGTNENLPAYRWYDRELGRVVVSTTDAALLEKRLSTGDGLLANDGVSRGNLFSGDAPDSLFTFSTLRRGGSSGVRSYYFYFASLYNIARTLSLFIADILRELHAATWQLVRNEKPRVRRFGFYPIVRAATTSLLRELSTFTVAGDIMRGVPAVYTTYIAYDEVAHHSGIARGDTLRVLRDIDRDIGRVARIAADAARPYHLVVLSDHGQSQGPTFRQAFGETLGDHVQRLISGEDNEKVRARVRSYLSTDEGWHALTAVLTEVGSEQQQRIPEPVRRVLREQVARKEVQLGPDQAPRIGPKQPGRDHEDVIVVASGNLGLISFPGADHRLTMEEIDARYPTLLVDLVLHPGIGFVMVRSREQGAMVLGRGGAYVLEPDEVIGMNPLKPFGLNAARHLRRTDGFDNVPDIVVNSTVNPRTGEVYAFEELVGSHGGLGGPQTRPFLLYPASLPLADGELVGAESIYRQLRCWMRAAQAETLAGPARDQGHA